MTLRRTRRRRASRASRIIQTLRSLALARVGVGMLRRRRGLALALRASPIGLVLAALVGALGIRRRRRRRLEAELPPGPPNESAPGHDIPSAGTAAESPPSVSVGASGPNEGAPGHAPANGSPSQPETASHPAG